MVMVCGYLWHWTVAIITLYVTMLQVGVLGVCSPYFGHSVLSSSDKELSRWLAPLYCAQVLLLSNLYAQWYCSLSFYSSASMDWLQNICPSTASWRPAVHICDQPTRACCLFRAQGQPTATGVYSLPVALRSSDVTEETFRRLLKTFLFNSLDN